MKRHTLRALATGMILAALCVLLPGTAMQRTATAGPVTPGEQPGKPLPAQLEWEVQDELFNVYIREPSGQRRLVLAEQSVIMHSALMQLSPDGRLVAFVTASDRGFRDAALWLIGSDGSGRRKLLESGAGYWVSGPLWSPDGRQLAYVKVIENQAGELLGTQLWLYDLRLDKSRPVVTDPAFAPPMIAGAASGLTWRADDGLHYTDRSGKTTRTFAIDPESGSLHEQSSTPTAPEGSQGVLACRNMVKPVPIRDYDGSIGNGYYVGYLDKYTYTTWEGYGSHPGVDISGGGVGNGTTVVAVADGHVEHAGWGGDWGHLVVLRHDGDGCEGTVFSAYAHMQSTPTVSGDISRNTTLGRVGSTGRSSGPHLHFQIDKNNTSHPYWPSRSGQCTSCNLDDPRNVVNNPDTDNIVKNHTHSPMRFVQDRAGSGDGGQQNCAGEGVILYEHPSYQGRCTRFTGDDNWLGDDNIGNDTVSSIRVIGNFEAALFEHSEYTGTSSTFTGDDPNTGNDAIGHDRASSVRVRRRDAGGGSNCDGGQGVYLYEHPSYGGRCSKFTSDSPNPRGWYLGNDAASAIRIIGNYEATVYEHDDYNGASSTFTGDDPDFGNDAIGHDRASSIRVRTRSSGGNSNCDGGEGAYLYEHTNYQGRCSKFTNDSPNPRGWYLGNDTASSIRFVGNYQATVYAHDDYNGAHTTFTGDDPDFGDDVIGHDRASSIGVQRRSSDPTSCPDGQYLVEYYSNRDLAGSPVVRRCEGAVGGDWGYGGPTGVGSDNFSFRATGRFWFSEGAYRFQVESDDGVRLWVDDQQLVNEWHDMGATTFTRERTLSAGIHRLKVEYYENGGRAVVRLSWTLLAAASDPDDGRTLGYDQGLDGTISPSGDRDDYYFDGSAGQAITIRMDKRNSDLDSYVELYNPDGSLLGRDDDNGGNRNARLAITLRQNGRHKIIARDYGSGTGGYRLSLSRESTADPDDNRWVAFSNTLQGTISPNNDRDWYYFSGVSGRSISIHMNKIDSGLDSYLELYNEAGVKVAENDDGGGDRNAWIVYTLPAGGTYRILARSFDLDSSGRYNLSLSSVSNSNLARGKGAWATSTEFCSVEPWKAFDGDVGTRWSSQFSDPQFIYVDLGSVMVFNQVILRWESAYGRRFGVYYWDGSQWRNVYWTDNGDGGTDTINFAPVRAQFVGMYGVQRGTPWGYSLWEFEVYDNTALVLPIVPPDPGDKPGETNVDPLTPLAPNDPDKATLLIGDGAEGQEDMPLAGEAAGAPTTGAQSGVPTAFILYPNEPSPAGDEILFQGVASDNDEGGQSIVEYRWTSSLDGQIGATDTFTLLKSALSRGRHVITFQARDNEGDWSEPVTTTLLLGSRLYLPVIQK